MIRTQGVSAAEKTLDLLGQYQKALADPAQSLKQRPDGGRDVIYYSVTPLEEKQARQQAETRNREKSLETVRKVIILKP